MKVVKKITVNIITVARMIVVFWFVFSNGNISPSWKMALIHSAIWCDMLDGSLARFWNVQSKTGQHLDSLADLALCVLIIPVVFPFWVWSYEKLFVVGILASATYLLARRTGKRWQGIHGSTSATLFIAGAFVSTALTGKLISKILGLTSAAAIIIVTFTLRKERVRHYVKYHSQVKNQTP